MADDISMETDDSEQVPGSLRSNKRKRALDIPDLKDMYQVNDNMLPHPIVDDVVVFMKRDGSGVRLGCVEKIDNKLKKNPMYTKYLCGSTAKLDAIPSSKRVVRCLEEVVLVDRPFFIGDTVVRFENAHLGEAREKERWCKESQIGSVINVKCMADLVVMPSKNVVVENIPIDGDSVEPVELINHNASHNYLMYKTSIGDATNSVSEVTLRYKDSHTVIVRINSHENNVDGVYLMRKDPTDDTKDLIKEEVVEMSVEDATGKFARWPDGIPLMLKRKKKALHRREQTEQFTVEKVRTVALDVKWIIIDTHGNSDKNKPDRRIDEKSLSKVHRFEPHVNTRFDPSDRIIVKTTDEAKAVSKRDYFKKLSTKYKGKFQKTDQLAAEDTPSSSQPSSSADGVCAKAAKLGTDSEESQPKEVNGEEKREKYEDDDEDENSSTDEDEEKGVVRRRSRRLNSQRRATRASCVPEQLQDGSCSAKELLGDEFIGEVLLTRTVVDVEWLDGSVSRDIPSYELSRKEVDFDQAHHMPGSIVINKDADERTQLFRYGVILETNGSERCCTVRWFQRHPSPLKLPWEVAEEETISLFDIMTHPKFSRGEMGMFGQLLKHLPESSGDLRETTMQVVENLKNGKQKFRLPNGTFREAWPDEIGWLPPVHRLVDNSDDEGESGTDSDPEISDPNVIAFEPANPARDRSHRDQRIKSFLHFMSVDIEDSDKVVVNRMRWFEAMFLMVRTPLKLFSSVVEHRSFTLRENPTFKDALDFAGYLHAYRHEAVNGDDLYGWMNRKFETTPEEEKPALRKYCYEMHALTMKYPEWFRIMRNDSMKFLFSLWSYLDSQKKMRRELFGKRRNITITELEEALGDKVDEYYSAAAWKEMTTDDVLGMFEESVEPPVWCYSSWDNKDGEKTVTEMLNSHSPGYGHRSKSCCYKRISDMIPDLEIFLENGLLDQYFDVSVYGSANTWQDVYDSSGERKELYDALIKSAPHTLRLKICGDSAVRMTDCFIWYHVLHQILQSPHQLPTTIFIDPSMEFDKDDDSVIRWMVLMQAGMVPAPFGECLADNRNDYKTAIEKAAVINTQWGNYPLQLADIYDSAARTDQREVSVCLNTFERFFPFKNILATIGHALSEADAVKPVSVVMEADVKEYTSGERNATVEQIEALKIWTGDDITDKVVDSKESRFEVLSECPRSHKFHSAPSGEGGVGRAFYTAVRKEHRLLREHIPEGIHVRAYEDRTDCLSFLIIGPTGTPYEGVPFMFDVKLPETYPEKPPEVHYVSYSAEQLNPNLYLCGKVCTSLLGTWSGEGVETWNAKNSNLLQVILSIQALILVREPYFNEAGYESRKDLPESGPNSKRYNETAAVNALEYLWKVIGADIFPFSDVIHKHVVCTWSGLREKLLRLSKDENSMPDYPVLGSKGFRLAIEKAVHRVDLRVNSELSAKLGSASIDADATSTTNDELATGTQIKEKVWPAVQEDADEYERAEGTIDLLSGYRDVRRFEFTKPVTCFMLRQE